MKKNISAFLIWLSICQFGQAQIIANFETASQTPTLSGTNAAVVDNPSKTSINLSDKVAFYKKEATNWKAIYLNFANKINVGKNDRLSFKIRSSTKGRVYTKVVEGSTTIHENWSPQYDFQPESNTWTECTLDLTSIQDKLFDRIEVNGSVDNTAEANIYVDDFRLYNSASPNGEPIIDLKLSNTQIAINQSINFDATQSYDTDGVIQNYEWKFSDGFQATGSVIDRTFTNEGIYTVELKVTDNDAKTSKKNVVFTVLPINKLGKLNFLTTNPAKYEKIEANFLVNATYTNVYDPDEVSINALITLPDQSQIAVPCFYFEKSAYQSLNDAWVKDNSQGYWMLRFSSAQIGIHKIQLKLTDKDGTVSNNEQTIDIQNSIRKGFIKLDADNKQYYRHTSGEPYYPLGINIAWNSTNKYHQIISNLAKGKANLVRYWHAAFDRQTLEWKNGSGFYKGLGIYSQEAAAEQDSILNLCEEKDIFLQMCIFHHGMFSENVNPNWNDNPYKASNGGPLNKAEEFFYNESAKKRTKKLLRYIVARWGYSANLFAWELFNEVQFTGVNGSQSSQWRTEVLNWHDEMGQYIKQLDAFKHPVTTSASDSQLLDLDAKQGLDILQYHLYNTNLLTTQNNTDKNFLSNLKRTAIICGEYGLDVNTANVPFDTQRIAIWTGIMNQVPHLMWLWDNYTDQTWADLFKYPADYLQNMDFVKEGALSNWTLKATYNGSGLGANGFHSAKNFYGLIYDANNRNDLSGVIADFSKLPAANYKITWYNTLTGETSVMNNVSISSVKNKVTLPKFSKAIAFKVTYISDINFPIASAGEDRSLELGNTINLNAINSYSPNNQTLTYIWELFSKPASSALTLSNPNQQAFDIKPDVLGVYKFSLKVQANNQISEADTVIITVTPITALEPLVELGNPIFYPNPSSEQIKIKFTPKITAQVTVGLSDLQGKTWVHLPMQVEATREIEWILIPEKYNLPSGVYLLELRIKDKSLVRRIVYDKR
jgi:hypothetical protein